MKRVLDRLRREYREEHGKEPPAEFINRAEVGIARHIGKADRDAHREIYDKLAEE